MKRLHIAALATVMLIIMLTGCRHGRSNSALITRLDSLITERETVDLSRREAITMRLAELTRATNPTDSYGIYRDLYDLYKNFDIDSAIIVSNSRLDNARRIGQTSKCVSASLNLAEAYTRSGSFSEALAILDTIPQSSLADYHISYRHSIYNKVYDGLESNTHVPELKAEYARLRRAARDSQLMCHAEGDVVYHHILALDMLDDGRPDDALAEILKSGSEEELADNAAANHILATVYHAKGETGREAEHLARAAILDLSSSNHEGLALMQLAELLNEQGDVDRAYRYLERAYQDALDAHAYVRADRILKSFPIIFQAYNKAESQRRHLLAYALTATVLALLLTVFAIKKLHTASINRQRLAESLKSSNEHLLESNAKLEEAAQARERFISELFDAHSDFINRIESYRKNINRLIKVGQYKRVAEIAQSTKPELDELQAMYTRFDAMFIYMYPNFVAEINKVLVPEARVDENTDTLTPELRIAALIKIGITSSTKIARMLHYSTQTVYNYRFRLRNNLTIPKEDFEAYIANI